MLDRCNRYRLSAGRIHMLARYGVSVQPDHDNLPAGELFPKRPAWVVREERGQRLLDVMTWGFPRQMPGKRLDKVTGKPVMVSTDVTNVRNYTSPFWRTALANPERRCLVPFTAFSEYGQTRGSDGKLPLHWFDVTDQEITSFAGVWRPLEGGGAVFAFLTCEPNPLVAPIHPKAMPVLLHPEDEKRWLACSFNDAVALAAPYPSQLMRAEPA